MAEAYEKAGVDYDTLDAGKRKAIEAAAGTDDRLRAHGGEAISRSRGEPAFAFTLDDQGFAFVLECLGTKSVLARQYQEQTGTNLFHNIGYDAVAAIVNDLICVGALPLVVTAYFATGHASWYADAARFEALVEGWAAGCRDSAATWGGGESPSLPGLIAQEDVDIAGSAVGRIPSSIAPILGDDLRAGDDIVLVASTGLHANGASLIRQVAKDSGEGLETKLPSGRTLGEASLDASAIYVSLVRELIDAGVSVSYLSHITGHGLRKLMRPARDFTFRITSLLEVPEVLTYVSDRLGFSPEDSYGTFNMGAGFAVYAPDGERVVSVAEKVGLRAEVCGRVEEGPRRVVLEPVGVTFESDTLSLR